MSANETTLPAGYEDLEQFVPFWAADSASGRARCRDTASEAERQTFYDAIKPRMVPALEYLNQTPLPDHSPAQQRLMLLLLSFAHVSLAVETQREEEAKHVQHRASMHITRAPADLPAA